MHLVLAAKSAGPHFLLAGGPKCKLDQLNLAPSLTKDPFTSLLLAGKPALPVPSRAEGRRVEGPFLSSACPEPAEGVFVCVSAAVGYN